MRPSRNQALPFRPAEREQGPELIEGQRVAFVAAGLGVLGFMRAFVPLFAALFLTFTDCAPGAETARKSSEEQSLSNFMAGEYDLIGRKPDSSVTYTGRVILRPDGKDLTFIRTVDGRTQKGKARFDTVAGADRIPVLRLRFILDGVEYQALYRWHTDPDNYFRFTGLFGREGVKSAGLEALFPIHR